MKYSHQRPLPHMAAGNGCMVARVACSPLLWAKGVLAGLMPPYSRMLGSPKPQLIDPHFLHQPWGDALRVDERLTWQRSSPRKRCQLGLLNFLAIPGCGPEMMCVQSLSRVTCTAAPQTPGVFWNKESGWIRNSEVSRLQIRPLFTENQNYFPCLARDAP